MEAGVSFIFLNLIGHYTAYNYVPETFPMKLASFAIPVISYAVRTMILRAQTAA